jgi:hypothetical protein
MPSPSSGSSCSWAGVLTRTRTRWRRRPPTCRLRSRHRHQLARGLPAHVDAVFRQALAKHPGDRYSTCTRFVPALRLAFRNAAAATRVVYDERARVQRQRVWPLPLALLPLAGIAAAGFFAIYRSGPGHRGGARQITVTARASTVVRTVTAPPATSRAASAGGTSARSLRRRFRATAPRSTPCGTPAGRRASASGRSGARWTQRPQRERLAATSRMCPPMHRGTQTRLAAPPTSGAASRFASHGVPDARGWPFPLR